MIHIFSIHSPITFLIAYTIIRKLGLKKEDVILLSSGYEVPFGDFRVEPAFHKISNSIFRKIIDFNAPKAHDRYIDVLTGNQPFIAYIDLMSYYQKVLVTHSKCISFNFIEEGNSTYQSYDDMTDLTWSERKTNYRIKGFFDGNLFRIIIRALRGYNLRLLSIPYNYMAFVNFKNIKFFCFSQNAFFNIPSDKRVILKPEANKEIQDMALGLSLINDCIWIDGSNGMFTDIPETYYHRAIDKAIGLLPYEIVEKKLIYVKLRNNNNIANNYLCTSLKNAGFTVEILSNSIILEALFIVSKNCYVIANLSSALEYAYCFGHKAYSIYSLFDVKKSSIFDRMDGFWSNIRSLNG